MCVIFCCEDKFPDYQQLKDGEKSNPHGAGVAWIEKGKVRYIKGINAKRINKMIRQKRISLPCIIHFRIASVGDIKKELTHPFPINRTANTDLVGNADAVLFHNGTISEWKDMVFECFKGRNIKIPGGKWSDSRALAICVNERGKGMLAKLDAWNKVAILTKDGILKFGSDWCDFNGTKCSNDYFTDKYTNDVFYDAYKTLTNNIEYKDNPSYEELKKDYDLDDREIDYFINAGYTIQDIINQYKAEADYVLYEDEEHYHNL